MQNDLRLSSGLVLCLGESDASFALKKSIE
jgi:hypothetical protein